MCRGFKIHRNGTVTCLNATSTELQGLAIINRHGVVFRVLVREGFRRTKSGQSLHIREMVLAMVAPSQLRASAPKTILQLTTDVVAPFQVSDSAK